MIRVLHLISAMGTGGANMMLYKMLIRINQSDFKNIIITLMRRSDLDDKIESLGISVVNLDMPRGRLPRPGNIFRLIKNARKINPDLIQGWMYHGNLAGLFVASFLQRRVPVCWNIRHSLHDIKKEKSLTKALIRIGALLSRRADLIINNSFRSKRQHEVIGYSAYQGVVVPNGFDCEIFRPDREARESVREELGVLPECRLIGMVARYHPMKDHRNFLNAAAILRGQGFGDVHYLLVGPEIEESNRQLTEIARDLALHERLHLLGERDDMPRITGALDVATLSSAWGEGFPNVIGEAMACGVPCVVTDVGDCARIVGDVGIVVKPQDPEALANGWRRILELPPKGRKDLADAARARVKREYLIDTIVVKYEDFYRQLLTRFHTCNRY